MVAIITSWMLTGVMSPKPVVVKVVTTQYSDMTYQWLGLSLYSNPYNFTWAFTNKSKRWLINQKPIQLRRHYWVLWHYRSLHFITQLSARHDVILVPRQDTQKKRHAKKWAINMNKDIEMESLYWNVDTSKSSPFLIRELKYSICKWNQILKI